MEAGRGVLRAFKRELRLSQPAARRSAEGALKGGVPCRAATEYNSRLPRPQNDRLTTVNRANPPSVRVLQGER